MSSQLISFASWYIFPNLITGVVQNVLYTVFIRAGDPKPTPNSPRFVRDRRRIHIAIIILYLLYSLYSADHDIRQQGDFYTLLGVPHDVTDRALQSRFRRLTVLHHPDKLPPGADRSAAEALFIRLQLARDTLSDPVKRFAYDRFGPGLFISHQAQHLTIHADYILPALRAAATFYVSSALGLILPAFLGYFRQGMFWRYLGLAALFVFEALVATRPQWPTVLTQVVNPFLQASGWNTAGYLPFQMVGVAREWVVSVFIAGAQLAGLLGSGQKGGAVGDVTPQMLDRIDALTKIADQEVGRLMGLELSPFVSATGGSSSGIGQQSSVTVTTELRTGLKEWLVQNAVRNDPEVKTAINTALDRRRGKEEDLSVSEIR